jgi:hypothetical protein
MERGVGPWDDDPGIPALVKPRSVPNRSNRLRAMGNAIVPQVAFEILVAIREVDAVPVDLIRDKW